jgi:hypothetical protein
MKTLLITIFLSLFISNSSHAVEVINLGGGKKKEATTPLTTDDVKPIEPPFGLNWGEESKSVITWAQKNGFPLVNGLTKDGRTCIEIEGPFPNVEFNRLRFYFQNDALVEAELQFNECFKNNGEGQENDVFTKALAIKNKIDEDFGKGKMLKNDKGEKDGYSWKFIQQIWTDEEHALWLAIFTSKQEEGVCIGMISLHYRWETKIEENKKKVQVENFAGEAKPETPRKKSIIEKLQEKLEKKQSQ